jgi:regulation of enolase protein 1 (concanavalin A-like superfamily)
LPLSIVLCFAAALNAATAHVASGPLNINGQNGTTIENLVITNPNGPCVTLTNSSNITIHNSEIGPCGAQGIVTNGGNNVKILDSYIHAETPGIVGRSGNQTTFDTGDNIYCSNTTNLLMQGNVIGWGEANVFLIGCASAVFKGNFCFNPITSTNLGQRGECIQVLDGSRNVTVDHNYVLASTDTSLWKYATYSSDLINFGSTGSAPVDGFTVTNNYITGGTFVYGCGINADGGTSASTNATPSVISGNNLLDVSTCGISIEGGYNFTINNNQVLSRNPLNFPSNNAFQLFSCYNAPGSACYNGEILPCGNITMSGNLGYASNNSGNVSGLYTGGAFPCSPVSYGAGNIFDSAPNGGAYNAMQPPATKLPVPMIPPVPYSCAAVSPYTNQTAQSCSGAVSPTISLMQPSANATLSGTVSLTAAPSSGVTSVSFIRDGSTLIGQATSSPWSISVDTTAIPNGAHSLAATATQSGVQTTSVSVPVTIQNAAPVVNTTPVPVTSAGLNTALWTVVNPAGGSASTNGSQLLLNVPAGSNHDPAFGGVNNSVRVVQKTGNANFTIEVKFDSIPKQQYQFEGVLVNQDASNYLRFQFGSSGSVMVANADIISAGTGTGAISANISATTASLWMRVQRAGNTWTQSWSGDGKTYNTVGSFTQTLNVSSVGPFAGNYNDTASAAPGFACTVDYFNNITPAAPGPFVSDNFNVSPVPSTGGLNTNIWNLVAPAGGSYKMNGTELLLTAPGGSNHDPSFNGANNSVRVMQTTGNADFTIESKFDSIPNSLYEFEGLLVGQDAGNYLRFQFGSNGSILVVGASVITSAVENSVFTPVITLPTGTKSLWMRITKSGSTWTETWSADGKNYNTVGSFTQPLTVTSIGPFVGNYNNTATASPAFVSAIDYVINTTAAMPGPPVSDGFNQ